MPSLSSSIIFLLGAGASKEADIPMSADMIGHIETSLATHEDWKPFRDLYHHIKSAILYSAGLQGRFGTTVPFNIETVVNALNELARNEEHTLYPFIASWNSRFVALASSDFSNVKKFRRLILKELNNWMCPEDASKSTYYRGFIGLQKSLNYPLHVFSLNYDLCMEKLNDSGFRVETGFSGNGPSHLWDWERFENADTASAMPELFLYKLHGSINWKRDTGKNLYAVDQIASVDADSMELIFGRDFKLEAADPYLFYAYQFRKFTLQASIIVAIGYGFADGHINKMMTQAIRANDDMCILVVARCNSEDEISERRKAISKILEVQEEKIIIEKGTAASFLEDPKIYTKLMARIPKSKNSPF